MTNPSQPTPISDAALSEQWPQFVARVLERMNRGKVDYGDRSFLSDISLTPEEIKQEFLDVAGWAFIGYVKMERLEAALKNQETKQ